MFVPSRPQLIMRWGQSKYKVKGHGALAGLPYRVKANGATVTEKTDQNIRGFIKAVQKVVHHIESIWFEDRTYLTDS